MASTTSNEDRTAKRCDDVPRTMKALQYVLRSSSPCTTLHDHHYRRDGISREETTQLTRPRYSAAETFAVVEIPVPEIGDDDVLVRCVEWSGVE